MFNVNRKASVLSNRFSRFFNFPAQQESECIKSLSIVKLETGMKSHKVFDKWNSEQLEQTAESPLELSYSHKF